MNNNKLIADFMGLHNQIKLIDNRYSWNDSPFFYMTDDSKDRVMEGIVEYSKYHTSWDWLMPVVHKCLSVCHNEMLNEWEESFADKLFTLSIESMYQETVEFIKWQNKGEIK